MGDNHLCHVDVGAFDGQDARPRLATVRHAATTGPSTRLPHLETHARRVTAAFSIAAMQINRRKIEGDICLLWTGLNDGGRLEANAQKSCDVGGSTNKPWRTKVYAKVREATFLAQELGTHSTGRT
eukprot:scaffold19271_cov28-Tisochrysis_lutea.AAC.9